MKTFCNPWNLSYKYQHDRLGKGYAYRGAADLTLIFFKGRYYFYVPNVYQVGEYLYFLDSRRGSKRPSLRSKEPLKDNFEVIPAEVKFGDTHRFCDGDGKVYFYGRRTRNKTLWGIELSPDTMIPKGKKVALVGRH